LKQSIRDAERAKPGHQYEYDEPFFEIESRKRKPR
jgi:hypothetical protein